jgi:Na+-translocating ferredoxin:NAD+ oxidoreductase RNF subunit RnfB
MSHIIIITILSLGVLALLAAIILYFIAQKFKVYEDPRIDEIQAILPGANCGGCGFAGCRAFAEALVRAESFDGLNCPPGGADVMAEAARLLGKEAPEVDPLVAVLKCNGRPEYRPLTSFYDGVPDCRIAHSLYLGETDCSYGCLGKGDCVRACPFDAMYMNSETGLPEIIDDKCVACGNCVKACPRNLIELRKKARKDRKIYVACSNCDRGGPARRACRVACIACMKCVKVCKFDAITVENYLAYIDSFKCTLCRKCVAECPTGSILEFNFPPRKPAAEVTSQTIKVNPEV